MSEKNLTPKELQLWKMMKARSGVLFLKSRPGVGKSAIIRGIAKKLGFNFIDLRLSTMDETDFGMPTKVEKEIGGKKVTVMEMCLPNWLYTTHTGPTLINFEELNRCSQNVQNAALGLLMERELHGVPVGEECYMVATGNTGFDGCNVEELDTAMRGRLIVREYDINIAEWEEAFAEKNVIQEIRDFIRDNPTHFYKAPAEDSDTSYASPRTWTFLSDYVKANGGNIMEMIPEISTVGASYIGPSASSLVSYLESKKTLTITDLLNLKKAIDIAKISRPDMIRLMQELTVLTEKTALEKYAGKKTERILDLMKNCERDLVAGFIMSLIRTQAFVTDKAPNTLKFLRDPYMKAIVDDLKAKSKENG
jgi:hypothetical protein